MTPMGGAKGGTACALGRRTGSLRANVLARCRTDWRRTRCPFMARLHAESQSARAILVPAVLRPVECRPDEPMSDSIERAGMSLVPVARSALSATKLSSARGLRRKARVPVRKTFQSTLLSRTSITAACAPRRSQSGFS